MRLSLVTGGVLLAISMQPLAAQNSGVSEADLFAAFEATGYELSDLDSKGNRGAKIPLEGEKPVNFNIRAVDCDNGQNCKAVIMFANFDLNEVTAQHKTAVGKFNDTKYFGRAYYVQNKVGIDSVVRVDSAGDIPYLRRRISDFREIVIDFLNHMRGK